MKIYRKAWTKEMKNPNPAMEETFPGHLGTWEDIDWMYDSQFNDSEEVEMSPGAWKGDFSSFYSNRKNDEVDMVNNEIIEYSKKVSGRIDQNMAILEGLKTKRLCMVRALQSQLTTVPFSETKESKAIRAKIPEINHYIARLKKFHYNEQELQDMIKFFREIRTPLEYKGQ